MILKYLKQYAEDSPVKPADLKRNHRPPISTEEIRRTLYALVKNEMAGVKLVRKKNSKDKVSDAYYPVD